MNGLVIRELRSEAKSAQSDVRNSRDTACEAAGSVTVREVRGLDQDTNRVEVVMRSKEAALPVLVAGLFTV